MNQTFAVSSDPRVLLDQIVTLRSEVIQEARTTMLHWPQNNPRRSCRASLLNLAVYLALRHRDLRDLQQGLISWGLSAFNSTSTSVIANLDAIIVSLTAICDQSGAYIRQRKGCRGAFYGERRLERNSVAVLGPRPAGRAAHIMVTLPPKAGEDYTFVKTLVVSGMSVARINCAHGSRDSWDAMITYIHRAEQETGHTCRILMDLCGTKPRIAELLLTGGDGRLNAGDRFLLTKQLFRQSNIPVAVTCTLPEIIDFLRVGDPVMVDDGKFEAIVTEHVSDGAIIKVLRAGPKGGRLKLQKGLNFPHTVHTLSPLTAKDLSDLDYVLCKADMVGYSFVKEASDIALLQQEIERRVGACAKNIPIVAKIETAQAIRNLPSIIAQGVGRQPFSLMIARGDLAVELGYQRLPEVQQEILLSARAAHIPAIWATQVLEGLLETGAPTRAEMTDAAMAARAECVMLNKGLYLAEAVTFLDSILSLR